MRDSVAARIRVPALVTNARHPIWLPAATQPGAWAFAVLYAVAHTNLYRPAPNAS